MKNKELEKRQLKLAKREKFKGILKKLKNELFLSEKRM